jgi:hypothetical protein
VSLRTVIPAFVVIAATRCVNADEAAPTSFVDAEALIRRVVKSQKLAEERMAAYTFDQLEVETKFAKGGRAKETETRLFYVFSGDAPGGGSRELVELNGRPATEDEKRKSADEEAKQKKKRLERRAARRVRNAPGVTGEDDDPLVGERRLSELLGRYRYWIDREEVRDGRLFYVLRFSPKPGLKTNGLAEQALAALAGEVTVDGTDYQVKRVEALLVSPVKVAGGLAARVEDAVVQYEAEPLAEGRWFPCAVDMRLRGKTAVFMRLDVGYRFQFSNFRSFKVETETAATAPPLDGERLEASRADE